jgi:hypothetical protein
MIIKSMTQQRVCKFGAASLLSLILAASLGGCGGGGGGTTTPPPAPPPSAKTFQATLDSVVAIDRTDGSVVQVTGSSISGATATLP